MGQALSRRLAAARGGGDAAGDADPNLWLIVGLGNPGPRYERTRHNAGFMLLDELARQEGVALTKLQANAAVARVAPVGGTRGAKAVLAKPMTFMNVSGESVGKLARFYRVPTERVLVVYDDLDLPPAAVRLRAKGGHGGHNGMKSVEAHLGGARDFPRLRIGVGRPPAGQAVAAYVLDEFLPGEREAVGAAIQDGVAAVRAVLALGLEKAVSGLRVDAEGRQVAPVPHQNGKGGKAEGGAGGKRKAAAAGGEEGAAKKQVAPAPAAAAAAD